jgi:hypothetical protein
MKGFKTGGRAAGTPNKTTKEMRELITDLSYKYLASDLESLEPRERAVILTRLLSYVVPRPGVEDSEEAEYIQPLVIVKTEYIDEEHKALLCKVEYNGE